MNYKLTALLIAVLVLVGGAVLITRTLGTKTPEEQHPRLYRIGQNDFDGIRITHEGASVEYQLLTDPEEIASALGEDAPSPEMESELWVIKDSHMTPVYEPDWSATPLLLSGPLTEGELESLDDKSADLARFGLDPPRTSVSLDFRGREIVNFHLGDPTPDEMNKYARRVGDDRLFIISGGWADSVSTLATEPPYAPTLFAVRLEDITLVSATSTPTIQRYDYELRDGVWTITEYGADGREWVATENANVPVDDQAWAEMLSLFSDPRISESQERDIEDAEIYGLPIDKARVAVLLRDTEGEETTFFLGDTTPEGDYWYAGAADQETLYYVPAEWGEEVLRLFTDPPFPP